ncbi:MAG: AAA family ATPase [Chloroflexi bacterium]|nr:AAA family ATPase [Chloroflexota bacterium]
MKVVAVVGMAGSGKSEVARIFEKHNFIRVRFGDLTDDEIKRRGLEPGETSERYVRELLRREHGMAAFAKLNLPRIDVALEHSNVVVDGLYSWEEYVFLRDYYKKNLYVIAVWAPPALRYERLMERKQRSLTLEEAASRDKAEIENTNKGGPIAMADCMILNRATLTELKEDVERIIASL